MMILKLADHESSTIAMRKEKQKRTILITGNSTCTNRQHLLNSSLSGQTAITVIINII